MHHSNPLPRQEEFSATAADIAMPAAQIANNRTLNKVVWSLLAAWADYTVRFPLPLLFKVLKIGHVFFSHVLPAIVYNHPELPCGQIATYLSKRSSLWLMVLMSCPAAVSMLFR